MPVELKEASTKQTTSPAGVGRKYIRAEKFNIQPYRKLIQWGFLLVTAWIGVEFTIFVHQLQSGSESVISRPPGVEAFLPISALISLRYWLLTGIFNTIHPAALVILLVILAITLLLKKGFCSWVCPIGLLSEYLAKLHIKLFDRQHYLPRWLDYPLRSLKYLLMFFFIFAVFVQMNLIDLHRFIYSPYNKVADIKMLLFFAGMSSFTFWVLFALVVLSVAVPYFWCRYLCPYGGLLGAVSWLSPFKIHRDPVSCIDCGKCNRACPSKIKVDTAKTVFSDECHTCLACVDACPVKDTLFLSLTKKKVKIPRKVYALAIVLIFLLGMTIARLTGFWQNSISTKEYKYHIRHLSDPAYFHNRGHVPDYQGYPPLPGASKADSR